MRVIGGTARRLQLKTLEGLETRPTQDRIKETLFNMINPSLFNSTFLDLYAGSGGIGIEALSRGAKQVVFVDSNAKAASCIKENLHHTKLNHKAQVITSNVIPALMLMEQNNVFDIIFMDPPYDQLMEKEVLSYLSNSSLIYEDSLIIVEASLLTDFSYVEKLGFHKIKEKKYKTNKHVFLELLGKEEVC